MRYRWRGIIPNETQNKSLLIYLLFFFQILCVSSSVLTLCAISVERYYAICRPLKAKITSRKVGIAIAFIWIIGIIVALPNLIFMEIERTYPDIDHLLVFCGMSLDPNLEMIYQLFIVLSTYLVPVFIMGVFYSLVSIHLWSAAAPGAQGKTIITGLRCTLKLHSLELGNVTLSYMI